jgi:ribosomal protein RSM22 (predicted rRNA methylase)
MLGSRESCSFSQRLQRPTFVRKTKHAKRGEEDLGYSYLVVARGERPAAAVSPDFMSLGRAGGVARDVTKRAREKSEGKHVLREVEGGGFEMVSLRENEADDHDMTTPIQEDVREEVNLVALREESYDWPRIVAPPIKRSGHVIMDTCHPSGMSQMQSLALLQRRLQREC